MESIIRKVAKVYEYFFKRIFVDQTNSLCSQSLPLPCIETQDFTAKMVATTLIWLVKVDRRTQSVFFPPLAAKKQRVFGVCGVQSVETLCQTKLNQTK